MPGLFGEAARIPESEKEERMKYRVRVIERWEGVVEVFEVAHPKASRVYAWSYRPDDTTTRMRTIAVLGMGPVVDAQTAVRAMLIAQAKKNEN